MKNLKLIAVCFLLVTSSGCKKENSIEALDLVNQTFEAKYKHDIYYKWDEYMHLDFKAGNVVEFYDSIEGIQVFDSKVKLTYSITNAESENPVVTIRGTLTEDVGYLKNGQSVNWSASFKRTPQVSSSRFEIDGYTYISH